MEKFLVEWHRSSGVYGARLVMGGMTIRTPSFSLVRARRALRWRSMYYRAARALTIILPCRFASLTLLSGCSTRRGRRGLSRVRSRVERSARARSRTPLTFSVAVPQQGVRCQRGEDPCEPEVIEDVGEDRRRGLVPRAGGGADLAVGAGGPTLDLRRGPPVDLWQDQIRVDPVAVFYGDVQQRVQQARPQIVRL